MNIDSVTQNLKTATKDNDPRRQAIGIMMAVWELTQFVACSEEVAEWFRRSRMPWMVNEIDVQEECESVFGIADWQDDDVQALVAAGYDVSMWVEANA